MKKRFYLTPVLILILCTSCTTMKRYNSFVAAETDSTLADAELFGFTLSKTRPETPGKTVWDLSADAQAQFIKILNARYPENEKFLNAMNFRYLHEEPQVLMPEDFVNKDLRMIFSISRQRDFNKRQSPSGFKISPADRIEYLNITLAIPEDTGIKFTGWNMFTTEYGSIEIGAISFSRNLEINAAGLLSAGKKESAGEISAGARSSTGRKEEQEIKYRYLRLNGRLKNNEIQIEEEGTREIDLTGNLIADISLKFEKFPVMLTRISNLQDTTGKFTEPESLKVSHPYVFVPRMEKARDTIKADLKMDYLYRHVIKGKKTFPEWDDRIRYYKGTVSRKIVLFSSGDYMPAFYCIGKAGSKANAEIIRMYGQDKRDFALIFNSLEEANSFYGWLRNFLTSSGNEEKKIVTGGFTLKYQDEDLTGNLSEKFDEMTLLPYYR